MTPEDEINDLPPEDEIRELKAEVGRLKAEVGRLKAEVGRLKAMLVTYQERDELQRGIVSSVALWATRLVFGFRVVGKGRELGMALQEGRNPMPEAGAFVGAFVARKTRLVTLPALAGLFGVLLLVWQNVEMRGQRLVTELELGAARRARLVATIYDRECGTTQDQDDACRPTASTRAQADAVIALLRIERASSARSIGCSPSSPNSDQGGKNADLCQDQDCRKALLPDWPATDLNHAPLANVVLSRADLSGAKLQKADLSDAKLNGAKLLGTDLQKARLKGAQLRTADLMEATLWHADLRGADLMDARLLGAMLSDADLRGTILKRANLRDAELHDALRLHDDPAIPDWFVRKWPGSDGTWGKLTPKTPPKPQLPTGSAPAPGTLPAD